MRWKFRLQIYHQNQLHVCWKTKNFQWNLLYQWLIFSFLRNCLILCRNHYIFSKILIQVKIWIRSCFDCELDALIVNRIIMLVIARMQWCHATAYLFARALRLAVSTRKRLVHQLQQQVFYFLIWIFFQKPDFSKRSEAEGQASLAWGRALFVARELGWNRKKSG